MASLDISTVPVFSARLPDHNLLTSCSLCAHMAKNRRFPEIFFGRCPLSHGLGIPAQPERSCAIMPQSSTPYRSEFATVDVRTCREASSCAISGRAMTVRSGAYHLAGACARAGRAMTVRPGARHLAGAFLVLSVVLACLAPAALASAGSTNPTPDRLEAAHAIPASAADLSRLGVQPGSGGMVSCLAGFPGVRPANARSGDLWLGPGSGLGDASLPPSAGRTSRIPLRL